MAATNLLVDGHYLFTMPFFAEDLFSQFAAGSAHFSRLFGVFPYPLIARARSRAFLASNNCPVSPSCTTSGIPPILLGMTVFDGLILNTHSLLLSEQS
jgi:hypothetical protein